jgi:hypothetical protein
MKPTTLIAIAASLVLGPIVRAEEGHEHAVAGPNQGKVLHEVEPHAELFVTKDRRIRITFLGEDGKPLPPADQSITVTCGSRSAPTRMEFTKLEDGFLSDKPLPDGMNIPTVLQIRMTPDGEKTTVRLNINLEKCPTCEHLEYACTCEHDH